MANELSRERQLETVLQRLLNVPDLNLDEIEDETREAIEEALRILEPDEELYRKEYELRAIRDRDKTEEQVQEYLRIKAEIRRRCPEVSRSPYWR